MLLDANALGSALNDFRSDLVRTSTDMDTSALLLVNAAQTPQTNTTAVAADMNQWERMQSVLIADFSQTWQAFVHLEFAVQQAYQQAIAQTYATLLADVDGNSTGQSVSSSLPSSNNGATSGSLGSGQGNGNSPNNGGVPSPNSISHDPLYVLDLNTGETVPANVSLNTFSTWSENLLAQVSGGAVNSYSWNVSGAPDLTNVSGTTTANLQGNWANFTGSAHTDTIRVTETPQVGQALTQTMTFVVAGTNSPAFSSNRPSSSSTWPTVITPDQMTSNQETVPGGPYARLGLADGSVQTSFSMPSYNPSTTPVSLDYNSTAANAQPIFLDEYQLPFNQAVPSTITAQLTFNNTPLATVTYNTSGLNPGDIVQIGLQANATGLSTGRYPWSITVTNNGTPTTYNGNVNIVNQANSPFGAGWALDNVEQLFPVTGGVILVNPDGTSLWFASNGQGGYTTPAGDFSTLTLSNGVYTRTMTDGTRINFNSNGQQTSTADRDGNTTTFGYSNGQLTTITDMNGQVTTLAYTSGLLSSITDPANRTAVLTYTGKQLTSITDPANDVWQYAYDSANDLTKLIDPNNHATTFTYNSADRVSSVTLADNSTEQLTPIQMNGWAAAGDSTNAVLLATGDQALFTDGNNNVWTKGLDRLGFGLPVLNTDPLGNTSLTYRDPNGLPWMSSDPLSRRTREFFNSQGDPTEIVNPDDTYGQYQYNSFSEVTQYTDPTGAVTTNTYNSKGDRTQQTNALNNSTTYTHNTAGLVTSSTDPLKNVTNFGYNSLNEMTSVTNALNQTTTYAYTNAGLVSSITDALGYVRSYTYDAMNRLTSKTLPDSKTVNSVYGYSYDKVGNETSMTDPLNHVTNYTYNAVNERTAVTNALNQTTTYTFDAVGNETSVTNALNQTTTFSYNTADEMTGITNALNNKYTLTYDAAGEKISETNPLSQTTTYGYNNRGWLATVTDPLGDQKSYTYDADGYLVIYGQLSTVSPPPLPPPPHGPDGFGGGGGLTLTSLIGYDAIHEVTSYTDPMNNKTTYGYDGDGNEISITDPLGHATSDGYNALNQLTSVTDTLGDQTSYGYDAVGNKTSVTNPLNQTNSYTFDAQGRVLTVTAPNGGVTKYNYDVDGNLLSLTDPDNNTTSYSYNAINQLVTMTNPLGYPATYTYDAAGELTSTTDADGRTINYAYNAIGQETSETWVGGNYTANYQYNSAGQLTNASDPNSVYAYTYDAAGRETSVSNAGTPGVLSVTLSYGYDAYGDRTSLSDSLGGGINYAFNNDQQVTSMLLTLNMVAEAQVTFSYDAASRLTGVTRMGQPGSHTISTSLSYDNADRLTNMTYTDTTASVTLADYTYGYDKASELTSYQDNNNSSLTYSYDANNELTGASGTLNGSNYSVAYAYDANGNRTMSGYQTGTGNELLSDGTYNYTYDRDGNMLSQTNIATGYVTYFTWDYRNRLIEVKQEDNHNNVLNDEKFTYDVNNNRIAVSLNGTTQLYTDYDGANPYMDFNGSGTLTQRYLTNPDGLSQFYGQVSGSGTTQWFLTDNVGSIRQVVSTGGSSLDAIIYDPYGKILSQTNASNAPRLGYTGADEDSLTGNVMFWARPYIPSEGSLTTPDWLGFAAGNPNLYGYVFNSPLQLIDPSGLDATSMGLPSRDPFTPPPPLAPFGPIIGNGTGSGSGETEPVDGGVTWPNTMPFPPLPPRPPQPIIPVPRGGGISFDGPGGVITVTRPSTPPQPGGAGKPNQPPGGHNGGAFFRPPIGTEGEGGEVTPFPDPTKKPIYPGSEGNPHSIFPDEIPEPRPIPGNLFPYGTGWGWAGEAGGWNVWFPADWTFWLFLNFPF